jgi:hypothetical protein
MAEPPRPRGASSASSTLRAPPRSWCAWSVVSVALGCATPLPPPCLSHSYASAPCQRVRTRTPPPHVVGLHSIYARRAYPSPRADRTEG